MPLKTPNKETVLTDAYRDYNKGLNSYAFFKLNDHEIGEDMVQDTFMKTWVYLVKKGKIELMRAFLYRILNNLIVDQYRKRKTSSLDILLEKGYEPSDSSAKNFVNLLDGKRSLILIHRLPEKYRNVMRMKYVEGLSLREMSMVTGQSKNAIAVQAYRGLEKLRILYQHP